MALNTLKCNYLTPLHFKGLTDNRLTNHKSQGHSRSDSVSAEYLWQLSENAVTPAPSTSVQLVSMWLMFGHLLVACSTSASPVNSPRVQPVTFNSFTHKHVLHCASKNDTDVASSGFRTFRLGGSQWGAMVFGRGLGIQREQLQASYTTNYILCKSLVLMPRVKFVEKYTKHAC